MITSRTNALGTCKSFFFQESETVKVCNDTEVASSKQNMIYLPNGTQHSENRFKIMVTYVHTILLTLCIPLKSVGRHDLALKPPGH